VKSRKEVPKLRGLRLSKGFYYLGGRRLWMSTSSMDLCLN
jgi:hypothetical protein